MKLYEAASEAFARFYGRRKIAHLQLNLFAVNTINFELNAHLIELVYFLSAIKSLHKSPAGRVDPHYVESGHQRSIIKLSWL